MVTNQLSFVKVDFDDEVMALLFLCTLLERWNVLVMVVSISVSSSHTLKFDDVVGVILRKEMRCKCTSETSRNVMQEHHSNPATHQLANTSSMHSMEGERCNLLVFQILENLY
jgi:hypothetical protein